MAAGFSLPEGKVEAFWAFLNDRLAAAAALPSAADLRVEVQLRWRGVPVAVPSAELAGAEGQTEPVSVDIGQLKV